MFIFEHVPYFATTSVRQSLHHIIRSEWIKLTLSVGDRAKEPKLKFVADDRFQLLELLNKVCDLSLVSN
jgi:hypothetical protein